jgi:hypothetical protein
MAHTPGPWINDNGLVAGSESRARFAPGVSVDLFDASQYPAELHDEMMANAALLSAAPELLIACKAAVHALRSYQYHNASTELAEEIADACEATIYKAEAV